MKDALYTHKFSNETVALHANEIVEYMVKNSLSLPTVCVCDLDFLKKTTQQHTIKIPSHDNGVSKDQNHVEVPEETGIINVLDDKSKREAYLIPYTTLICM